MIRKSMFNKHIDAGNEQRGVAPIIATLLMVAIAVVGGILIFVFAQGFFNRTNGLEVGSNEALVLTGYDARDVEKLRYHDGSSIGTVNAAPDGKLKGADDTFALYVRNSGTNGVTISSIECNSITHSTFDDLAVYSPSGPAAGTFAVDADTGVPNGDADAEVAGGESATIIIGYGGSSADDLPNGRNMSCKVFTQGGNVFTIPVSIGKRET